MDNPSGIVMRTHKSQSIKKWHPRDRAKPFPLISAGFVSHGDDKKLFVRAIILIVSGTSIGFITLEMLVFWYIYQKRRTTDEAGISFAKDTHMNHHYDFLFGVSFEEIKHMTSNFATQLGSSVYIGVSQEIFVLFATDRDFRIVISTYGGMYHQYLWPLKGFCFEEHKWLLYEYVSNVSMDKLLFDVEQRMMELNWIQKFDIALRVARALTYLHTKCPLACDTGPSFAQICSNWDVNRREYFCRFCKSFDDDIEKGSFQFHDCGIYRAGDIDMRDVMLISAESKSIRELLATCHGQICLTSSPWKSNCDDQINCVTAHFVDHEWRLQKEILKLKLIFHPYDSLFVANEMVLWVVPWNIEHKVSSLTLENLSSDDCVANMMRSQLIVKRASWQVHSHLIDMVRGWCYRCLIPISMPTTTCQRCSNRDILEVVPGIIGCLKAQDALTIASDVCAQAWANEVELLEEYSRLNLEDKVLSLEEGNVMDREPSYAIKDHAKLCREITCEEEAKDVRYHVSRSQRRWMLSI